VIDLPTDEDNIRIASQFYQLGKPTAAVCHGPAALLNAIDGQGNSIFAGKNFTGISNAEEEAVSGAKSIPFLLEDALQVKGGKFEKAEELWGAKVVVDGILITGQNPNSARGVGQAIARALA